MKRRAERKLDVGEAEQLFPKGAGEHRVTVAHDQAGNVVEAHNFIKEDTREGRHRVWVS